MSIEKHKSSDGTTITIRVNGAFTFDVLSDFRDAYIEDEKKGRFIVDLRNTDMMDSSALGMLLNMKKFLDKNDGEIKIVNASDNLRKILMITRFDKKFSIE